MRLSKGKLTTEPEGHTGEGIFFATRMFDEFSILSGQLLLHHFQDGDDWLVETRLEEHNGTLVQMSISMRSGRTKKEVFDIYASESTSWAFARTHVPVALATYGDEKLVSRSRARRLLARFDRFEEVLLDFEGVPSIGQAFADEIFRVFQNEHPSVRIGYVRATDEVEGMIRRATNGRGVNQLPLDLTVSDHSSSTDHGTVT